MSGIRPSTDSNERIRALILAAGRGERMRPLTDTTPKPLLEVRGKPLMQWSMEALACGGFRQLVVNTAWLGEKISSHFGLNPLWDGRGELSISYSPEGRDFGGALETAGGIVRALALLGEMFWVVAGDVFAPDFEFAQEAVERFTASGMLAHLWLVPNPPHHPNGDFGLSKDGLATHPSAGSHEPRYTFSTIGLYRAALFAPPYSHIASGNAHGIRKPLAPILRAAMDDQKVSAEIYLGEWADVGTPERLAALNLRKEGSAPR